MCGFIAVTGQLQDEKMNKILTSMKHRGPDEGDHIKLDSFHFGHRRLSIVGVDEGKQPIANKAADKYIVCNGEIYNFPVLKREMEHDTEFLTESDSEIALKLYERIGVEGVKLLDGMFAFVIADVNKGSFFAARDTLGIKPLYYGEDKEGNLVFASELKSVYFIADEAKEFPPGHYYTPETGFVQYRRIEAAKETFPADSAEKKILSGLKEKLEQAVEKRLMADVPLGVLLSGGLDSSLIAAITAKKHQGKDPLNSFCVGIEGSPDIAAARDVAEAIGTKHYEYVYTKEELIEALPEVIYHLESYDPSLVRSAIPCFFVSKIAAEKVKVVLSGEGADELFSGYAYLQELKDSDKLNKELVRIINSLHNINLQRLDRMSMAHSLEGRVPFLDLDLIDYALRIPAEMKLSSDDIMEKAVLRRAFKGELPEHILWRKKAEFSEGSGAVDILEEYAEAAISDVEYQKEKKVHPVEIRSKQELLYYRIFKEYFPQDSALETVGHWATS